MTRLVIQPQCPKEPASPLVVLPTDSSSNETGTKDVERPWQVLQKREGKRQSVHKGTSNASSLTAANT